MHAATSELGLELLRKGSRETATEAQRQAADLIEQGAPHEALKLISAIRPRRRAAGDWFLYGQALLRIGHFRKALGAFQAGLKADPHNRVAVYCSGLCQEGLGRYSRALTLFKEAALDVPEAAEKVADYEDGGMRRLQMRRSFERRRDLRAALFLVMLPLVVAMAAVGVSIWLAQAPSFDFVNLFKF
jgi:tetratricopeptide (TPR) repeat protein